MLGVKIYIGLARKKSRLGYSYVTETMSGELIVSRYGRSRTWNGNIVIRAITETLKNKNYHFTHIGIYTDDPFAIHIANSIQNKLEYLKSQGDNFGNKTKRGQGKRVSEIAYKLHKKNIKLIVQDEPTSDLYFTVLENAKYAIKTNSSGRV